MKNEITHTEYRIMKAIFEGAQNSKRHIDNVQNAIEYLLDPKGEESGQLIDEFGDAIYGGDGDFDSFLSIFNIRVTE